MKLSVYTKYHVIGTSVIFLILFSGPYFGATFEYYWSLCGPFFPWIFLKILAKIGKNWKTIKIPKSMDEQV